MANYLILNLSIILIEFICYYLLFYYDDEETYLFPMIYHYVIKKHGYYLLLVTLIINNLTLYCILKNYFELFCFFLISNLFIFIKPIKRNIFKNYLS